MKKIIYLTLILLFTNLANAVEPIVNVGWLNNNLDKTKLMADLMRPLRKVTYQGLFTQII